MTLDRRTVVRGTAWAVPAVAISTQAPAFAASLCGPVPFPSGWSVATTGTFQNGSGIQEFSTTYAPGDTINRYVSEADNGAVNANQSEATVANSATITVEKVLTLVPGRAYTFTFSIASRYSGDNSSNSQNQHLQIQTVVAGAAADRLRLVKGQNDSTHFGNLVAGGWTRLPPLTVPPTTGVQVQTYAFDYTPPSGVSTVTLRYLYTMPSRRRTGNNATFTGQADIGVSAPTITGQGC